MPYSTEVLQQAIEAVLRDSPRRARLAVERERSARRDRPWTDVESLTPQRQSLRQWAAQGALAEPIPAPQAVAARFEAHFGCRPRQRGRLNLYYLAELVEMAMARQG